MIIIDITYNIIVLLLIIIIKEFRSEFVSVGAQTWLSGGSSGSGFDVVVCTIHPPPGYKSPLSLLLTQCHVTQCETDSETDR